MPDALTTGSIPQQLEPGHFNGRNLLSSDSLFTPNAGVPPSLQEAATHAGALTRDLLPICKSSLRRMRLLFLYDEPVAGSEPVHS